MTNTITGSASLGTDKARVTLPIGARAVEHLMVGAFVKRGSTAHFNVSYDDGLGTDGPTIADAVLGVCEADFTNLREYFGGITPPNLPFNIVLTTGNNGASHGSCADVNLSIGARSGPGVDIPFIRSLVIAEEDEVFEAAFGHGWDCGKSNGEGLSRVLANAMYPGAEPANFVSAPVWLNAAGRPDFINNTDNTDINYVSIGCSVLFLNWLRYQLRFSWEQIIAAGAPTLAQTYTNLTGLSDALSRFKGTMQAIFPEGNPANLTTDNPFPLPTYKIESRSSGKVLDVPAFAPADQVQIQQFTDNGGANQQWLLLPVNGGFFKIVSESSGKVLDVPGFAADDGVIIQQFEDNEGTNQQWQVTVVDNDAGFYKIQSRSSGKVLDIPGFSPDDGVLIQQFTDNGGTNQQWGFVPTNALYKIVSRSSRKVLDVPGFAPDDQVQIQQFTDNGGTNQQWLLAPTGGGFFKIVSESSGKVLDVPGFAADDGVIIQQFEDNGGTNQQWQLMLVDVGTYKIVSRSSGKVLDVTGFSPDDGVLIQQFTDNGGTNQQWQLIRLRRGLP